MAMDLTLYFAINNFSCPDILFHELPKKPPDGILTELLVVTAVAIIYSILILSHGYLLIIKWAHLFFVGFPVQININPYIPILDSSIKMQRPDFDIIAR